MLTKKEVLHIAHLAKIKISDKKADQFTGELKDILEFFSKLQKVDTNKVPETSQVTGLENITRIDEVEVFTDEDDLLECTPHKIENHSVKIPRIM